MKPHFFKKGICARCGCSEKAVLAFRWSCTESYVSEAAIVWETSALMANSFEEIFRAFDVFALEHRISVRHILPLEVKQELRKYFDDPEKSQKAHHARRALSEYLVPSTNYEEVDLSDQAIPTDCDTCLGPDSTKDKRILGFALSLSQSSSSLVAVATQDGGLIYEIERRKRVGGALRAITSPDDTHTILSSPTKT
jgi:hypothetical protein